MTSAWQRVALYQCCLRGGQPYGSLHITVHGKHEITAIRVRSLRMCIFASAGASRTESRRRTTARRVARTGRLLAGAAPPVHSMAAVEGAHAVRELAAPGTEVSTQRFANGVKYLSHVTMKCRESSATHSCCISSRAGL